MWVPLLVVFALQWFLALGLFCLLQGRFHRLETLLFIAPACFFLLVLGASAGSLFFLESLALGVLLVVCVPWASRRTFAFVSLAGCAVVLGAASLRAYHDVLHYQRENPIVSVADRLAYESTRPVRPTSLVGSDRMPTADYLALSVSATELEQRLEKDAWRAHYRADALRLIHRDVNTAFASAVGFGVGRMPSLKHQFERSERESDPIPQEDSPRAESPSAETENPRTLAATPLPLAQDRLRDLQLDSLVDFANVVGRGLIESRQSVLGFQPHGFSKRPALERADDDAGGGDWRIARLELVSLLKHDSPGVYLSERLPAMEELREAKTRPLDRFEEGALVRLYAGEDLIVRPAETRVRMLGSIRALKQCLECHSVESGELLGAFSYHLERSGAAEPEPTGQSEFEPEPPEDSSDKPVL